MKVFVAINLVSFPKLGGNNFGIILNQRSLSFFMVVSYLKCAPSRSPTLPQEAFNSNLKLDQSIDNSVHGALISSLPIVVSIITTSHVTFKAILDS